jgi:large subunit ribosomal protein L9
MEIILKKNVDKLGYRDEVVTVKNGYGRNFLIPQGYALLATPSNKKAHEEMLKQRAHKETKILAEAEALAAKLADVTVKIATKVGENGKIFGSVNTVQLADALRVAGYDVDRKSLKIKDEPIKEVGTFEAEVNLHKGVKPTINKKRSVNPTFFYSVTHLSFLISPRITTFLFLLYSSAANNICSLVSLLILTPEDPEFLTSI